MSSVKYETHQDDTISQSKLVANPVTEKFQIVCDWFKRRSILEICLMVLTLIFIIIMIALAIAYDVKGPRERKNKQRTCLTPGCVRVAARISDSVDTTIKPCEDFYNFACGGWMKKTIIPKGDSGYSILHEIYDDVEKILKESLEKPSVPTEAEAIKKARRFYKSCVDEDKLEALGNKPLLDFINDIGEWPVIASNWSDTDYDLEKLLIQISKNDDYPIISLEVTADEEEPQNNILFLREPIFGLPFRHSRLNDPVVKMLQDMMVTVSVWLGANETTANQDAWDMVEFAIKLENISVPEKIDPPPTGGGFNENQTEVDVPSGPTTAPTVPEKKMTLEAISQKYPDANFNWLSYVQGIMTAAGVPTSITKDEYLKIDTHHYFERLFAVLNATPKRTITNYAIWRSIEVKLYQNPIKIRVLFDKYLDAIYGEYPIPPRFKFCTQHTTSILKKAVSRGFIQEAFDKEAKADVLQMIKTMQASFNGLLATNDWMDDVSRKGAKNKSDSLTMKIGYDERLLDDTYLNTLYQNFNWLSYVQGIMTAAGVPTSITKDEYLKIDTHHYFERLFAVLNATPKRTITNYAIWRSIEVKLYQNPIKIRVLFDKYLDAIYGEYPIPPRFKFCTQHTTSILKKAVSRGFIQEAFDKEAKADVLQMIKTMQASFNGLLATNDWMDDVSRKGAKNKSDSLTMKIGYDERLLDDTYLNTLYQNYMYNDDTYLWNMVRYRRELHSVGLRKLRIKNVVSKDDTWNYDPFVVNTFYSAPKNEIEFSAGIIQPPYYHKDFPAYVNFAGIGDAIGHELTHSGLDDRGEIKHANGKSTKWWTDNVIKNFQKNALCLTNQYNSYTLPGMKIKVFGERHLKENIADNGGLKLSFQAYRDWVQQRGAEEPMLPGLDLTPNQIFFINYAQSTCEKYTKAGHISNNWYGFHSPGRYRVIGTLQNSPEFAKTFGCAVGSYMNPVKKCKLW